MVHVVVGAANAACAPLLREMYRHRFEIFVREKRWSLKTVDGLERDEYDTPQTIYLIEFVKAGVIGASMRMNATDRPFMLADHFADMCDRELPQGKDVWELTRGAVSSDLKRSGIYARVICGMVEAALLWGAKKGVGIFSVEYLTKQMQFGLDAKPLGQPRLMDGEPHVAAEIIFARDTLERLRATFKLQGPVIERISLNPEPTTA